MLTKEDLSPELQDSYIRTLNSIGKDETWGEVALNMKSLEEWEKFKGFGLFRNSGFIAQINNKLKGHNSMTADIAYEINQKDIEELSSKVAYLEKVVSNMRVAPTTEERIVNMEKRVEEMTRKISHYVPLMDEKIRKAEENEKAIKELISKMNTLEKMVMRNNGSNSDLLIADINRRLNALEGRLEDDGLTD